MLQEQDKAIQKTESFLPFGRFEHQSDKHVFSDMFIFAMVFQK